MMRISISQRLLLTLAMSNILFFHRRAINFARNGAASNLLVAAGALSDCAYAVVNENVGMATYTPNNLPSSVAAWVLHHFDQEGLDDVSILLENKILISPIHTHLLRKCNQVALEIAHRTVSIIRNKRQYYYPLIIITIRVVSSIDSAYTGSFKESCYYYCIKISILY